MSYLYMAGLTSLCGCLVSASCPGSRQMPEEYSQLYTSTSNMSPDAGLFLSQQLMDQHTRVSFSLECRVLTTQDESESENS